MLETVLPSTTTGNDGATTSAQSPSLVHAAAKLPAGLLELVGLTVGAVTIRADEYSARISIAGQPRHPEDASLSTCLDAEDVRALHGLLGAVLATWDAAEPA